MDNLLTPEEQANLALENEPAPEADIPQIEQQPRDEQGRFAPVEQPIAEQPKQQTRQVPHGALHAEREAHKSTKAQLQELQSRLNGIAELRQRILTAQQAEEGQPQQQQAPVQAGQQPVQTEQQVQQPAPGTDHLQNRLRALEQAREQDQKRADVATVNAHETHLITSEITRSEQEFAQATPDYPQAVNHLVGMRARELQRYGMDPMSIQETIKQEALDLARSAIQLGMSPAEMAYAVAQDRGYNPQVQQKQPSNQAVQMLEAIERGQRSSKSLSSAPGAISQADLSADAVANMSEADFLRLYNTPEGRKMLDAIG